MKRFAICAFALLACGGGEPSASEDEALAGAFAPSPEDETIDPGDPPTDPDPPEDATIAPRTLGSGCPKVDHLSPRGLTFAIDVVDQDQLADLVDVKRFLRARDILVLRIEGGFRDAIQTHFPCNRVVALVWPDKTPNLGALEMRDPGIDGAALDWEGGDQVGSIDAQLPRLRNLSKRIENHGLTSILVPAGARETWMPLTHRGGFSWLFGQLQPACKSDAPAFAHAAKALALDAKGSVGVRNVAFEISMDSSPAADNHVDAARAAQCTREAYGKGARAIYIYGQKRDHLAGFFHELAKQGVRTAR